MTYSTNLNHEYQLIEVRCQGNLDIDEIQEMDEHIIEILHEGSDGKLHLLTDLTDVTSHPNNLAKVWSHTKPIASHPRLGMWFVIGGKGPFTQFLIETISYLGKMRVKTVKNRDAVINCLASKQV